jgi:hypothetical protein
MKLMAWASRLSGLVALSASLAACSGSHSTVPAAPLAGDAAAARAASPLEPAAAQRPPAWTGKTAAATLTLRIPEPRRSGIPPRRPRYVPASSRSIAVTVLKVNGSVISATPQVTSLSPGTSPCGTVTSGDYTCTIQVVLPIGTDVTELSVYDATGAAGNLLSQQVSSLTVVEGVNNQFGSGSPITLDANPGALSVTALSGPTGTYPNFTVTGTSNATFTVGVVDTHGTAFGSQPGKPTITQAAATGTGASASVSGTTLTLTPPSSGSSTNVVVDADPAGTLDVNTSLSASASAAATSFAVASATGIYAGQNLELDYETFSGSTLIQEAVHVLSVSGTTVTISSGLAHAHASGAKVYHSSDNLTSSTAPFTVTISAPPSVIVPIASTGAASPSKVLPYACCFSALTPGPALSSAATASFDLGRFDALGNLFVADVENDAVYKAPYNSTTGFGGSSALSGVVNQPGVPSFDVGPGTTAGGTVAVENSTSPQLDFWAPGGSGNPTGFNSVLAGPGYVPTLEQGYPSVAVMSDSTGATFGFAYDVASSTSTRDEIVVTNGTSSEQDLSNSAIVSNYNADVAVPVMTWDAGRQSLIYANSGSGFEVLEFPRNGTTGAILQTTPNLVGPASGYPHWVAASPDGAYVAVAGDDGSGGSKVTIYHYSSPSWSKISTGTSIDGKDFSNFTSMRFTGGGNLIVADSNGTYSHLYAYTDAGGSACATGCTNGYFDLSSSFPNLLINDIAVLH